MKVVVSGNYGAGNLGDEMILEGVITMLREVCDSPEITVLSKDPEGTRTHFNVSAQHKVPAGFRSIAFGSIRYLFSTRPHVKNCDIFLLGGGGLFNELSVKAHYIWAMQALAALRFRKPLVMYGQSVGHIKNPITKRIVKFLFKKAAYISVRDKDSVEALKKLGVKQKIHLAPDMAFRNELIEMRKRKKNIIVALRALKKLPPNFMKEFTGFIDWLVKNRNYKIRFIDFQIGEDRKMHDEIYDALSRHSNIDFLGHPRIPEPYFREAEFVIGMRLHSIITAIKAHTPFLALNYASKVEGLLKTIGFQKKIIDLADVSKEKLIEEFEALEKRKEGVCNKMRRYTEKAVKDHQSTEIEFKRFLTSLSGS